MYNAGIYIRVSVLDSYDENECQSAENQVNIIKTYLKTKNEINLYKIYSDLGKSGMTDKREGLKELLSDIYSGTINCVIVKDVSRLGRNYSQTGSLIENVFPFWGVRFISVNDNYDSKSVFNDNNIIGLKNILNEGYVRDISKKEKTALRVLMKEGKFLGSSAPYGYIKNGKKLDVDTDAAQVVRRIFNMAISNVSCYKTAKILNEEKVPPPYAYKVSKGILKQKNNISGLWREETIKRILNNRAYVGDTVQSVTTTLMPKGKSVRLPEEKWIIAENTHEAIISRSDFETAERILKNSKTASFKAKNKSENKKLNIYCGRCGLKMSLKNINTKNGKTGYYVCSLSSSGGLCRKGGIKSRIIIKTAVKILNLYCGIYCDLINFQEAKTINKIQRKKNYEVLKKAILYEKMKSRKISCDEFEYKKMDICLKEEMLDKKINLMLSKENINAYNFEHMLSALTERITVSQNNEIEFKMRFNNPFIL